MSISHDAISSAPVSGSAQAAAPPADDGSLSIFLALVEQDDEQWHGGALGFRIDAPPAEIAQQFVVDVEHELDEYNYDFLTQQVEAPAVEAFQRDFVADAEPDEDEPAPELLPQLVEPDAEFVLLDDVVEEQDDFNYDFVAHQVEQPTAPEEVAQQFLDEAQHDEDERADDFLHSAVEAAAPLEEIEPQFIADPEEEPENWHGGALGFRIDEPGVAELFQQFLDLSEHVEDERAEEFVFNLQPEAMPALEEIAPIFVDDYWEADEGRAQGTLGFFIDDVEVIQQFIEQQYEEVELFEDFLTNLLPEAGAAPVEIAQQFIEQQHEEDELFEDFIFNLLLDVVAPPDEVVQHFIDDVRDDDELAFEDFLFNLLPDAPPEEVVQQFVEELFEEEPDYYDFSAISNYVPDAPPVPAPTRLRYDVRTGLWVLIINDQLAMTL